MLKIISSELTTRCLPKSQFLAALTPITQEKRNNSFRTKENNPTKHSNANLGQFYKIPDDLHQKLFQYGGIPKSYAVQSKTFTETCVMVREPAIDVINCINAIDLSKPMVRFVLYGKKGSGKSLTLLHLMHFAHQSNFLLVHVPWVGNWMRYCKEYSNSTTKEGYVDTNLDAAAWLVHFKAQNLEKLQRNEFVTSKEYVWSKRETTEKGAPILEMIDHGINRVKYASDCVVFLSEEIKKLTSEGVCKTFVAIDGFNAFFYPHTRVKNEKKEYVHPHKVVITEAFLNFTRFDWKNAVCVVTVDELAVTGIEPSYLPRYLLGKEGFEHLDPFVPISVDDYNVKELTSCMDYYRERKWVQPLPGLDDELSSLSGNNPYKLMELCGPL